MSPHPVEGALVRLVDGEVPEPERSQVAVHLQQCAGCARALGAIETRSRSLVALLERADPTPRAFTLTNHRPVQPSRLWPIAAAAVLALGAAAVAATPVRGWILERWTDLRRVIGGASHATETRPPGRAVDSAGGVSFLLVSDVLSVRLATRQVAGQLVIELTDSPRVVAEVTAAGGTGAEFVVLPDELRIANSTASRASYHIAVPRRVTRVIVSIAGEPTIVIAPPSERRIVNLSIQRKP